LTNRTLTTAAAVAVTGLIVALNVYLLIQIFGGG